MKVQNAPYTGTKNPWGVSAHSPAWALRGRDGRAPPRRSQEVPFYPWPEARAKTPASFPSRGLLALARWCVPVQPARLKNTPRTDFKCTCSSRGGNNRHGALRRKCHVDRATQDEQQYMIRSPLVNLRQSTRRHICDGQHVRADPERETC